jgi:hypothetical protein
VPFQCASARDHVAVAITVRLETERGEEVRFLDPDDRVNRLVVVADAATACSRFIDPYGNTVFNSLQAAVLANELRDLGSAIGIETDDLCELIDDCTHQTHHYIRFIGD